MESQTSTFPSNGEGTSTSFSFADPIGIPETRNTPDPTERACDEATHPQQKDETKEQVSSTVDGEKQIYEEIEDAFRRILKTSLKNGSIGGESEQSLVDSFSEHYRRVSHDVNMTIEDKMHSFIGQVFAKITGKLTPEQNEIVTALSEMVENSLKNLSDEMNLKFEEHLMFHNQIENELAVVKSDLEEQIDEINSKIYEQEEERPTLKDEMELRNYRLEIENRFAKGQRDLQLRVVELEKLVTSNAGENEMSWLDTNDHLAQFETQIKYANDRISSYSDDIDENHEEMNERIDRVQTRIDRIEWDLNIASDEVAEITSTTSEESSGGIQIRAAVESLLRAEEGVDPGNPPLVIDEEGESEEKEEEEEEPEMNRVQPLPENIDDEDRAIFGLLDVGDLQRCPTPRREPEHRAENFLGWGGEWDDLEIEKGDEQKEEEVYSTKIRFKSDMRGVKEDSPFFELAQRGRGVYMAVVDVDDVSEFFVFVKKKKLMFEFSRKGWVDILDAYDNLKLFVNDEGHERKQITLGDNFLGKKWVKKHFSLRRKMNERTRKRRRRRMQAES
ncbi:hypothetical protein QAD02_020666 [Eretmocerus hayati]|uniref:Uncharacterized protein n=1 Tax=Eretmocerus hayati TaxID=131215 RepID=A0ACC2PP27_9HYME|nr:hypothetical protein QAD02_020666 [Eretmocerus hayati]